MSVMTRPPWEVSVDLWGDDEVTFARATLKYRHHVVIGRGAARTCATTKSAPGLGDGAAVGAALEDLGQKLIAAAERTRAIRSG